METENDKFCSQIQVLWGDPFYFNCDKTNILNEKAWGFAASKFKSIGILLRYSNRSNNILLLCLTIYTSGKVICSNDSPICMYKLIPKIMTLEMKKKLNFEKIHNNGRLLTSEEMLFLVERGSLLLFSWSNSISEWIQTPIMFIYSSIFYGYIEPLKLSDYLSYSSTRRSGYNVKFRCPIRNITVKDYSEINNESDLEIVSIDDYKSHKVINKQPKKKCRKFNEQIRYVINTNNNDSTKNWTLLTSKQPHETFYIERDIISEKSEVIVSVISINSETKFKISYPNL
ncbi:hypothetical protein FG386_001667 [Cryptosporidium ryanae]|uniref:uncharacterized protein n=1 Tax=Cryptosporidium ryanae TaxID=515981 RepID=UPI00351A1491|nr:hypothetical protein FG386_001667 [Cryptosporidium ryanae]